MPNLTKINVHPQIRGFVTMLCEGFNVPSSETKIQAFAEKLKHPHIPALKETYNIFTDGRGSTNRMPTIAEVMEIYKNVERRLTKQEVQQITFDSTNEINLEQNRDMFNKLKQTIITGGKPTMNIIDKPVTDFQNGCKFTITRDDSGQDWVKYHNHPINDK